jgi:hypothetical protein
MSQAYFVPYAPVSPQGLEPDVIVDEGARRDGQLIRISDMDPFDALGAADRFHQWIEAVTDKAVDPLDTRSEKYRPAGRQLLEPSSLLSPAARPAVIGEPSCRQCLGLSPPQILQRLEIVDYI